MIKTWASWNWRLWVGDQWFKIIQDLSTNKHYTISKIFQQFLSVLTKVLLVVKRSYWQWMLIFSLIKFCRLILMINTVIIVWMEDWCSLETINKFNIVMAFTRCQWQETEETVREPSLFLKLPKQTLLKRFRLETIGIKSEKQFAKKSPIAIQPFWCPFSKKQII